MNIDEVIDLKATALTGAVRLTWGVSSTAYLESFTIVVEKNDVLVERIAGVNAGAREQTIDDLSGTGHTFNVEAIVAQGGKVVACDPLPAEPTPPPPVTTNLVGANGAITKQQMEQLKARGANVTRVDEGQAQALRLSLAEVAQFAVEVGIKVVWICFQDETTACLQAFHAMTAAQQETIAAVEYLNEVWPEGVGKDHSGHEYRQMFCRERKRWNTLYPEVVLLAQVDNAGGDKPWAEAFFASEGHAELKEALTGPAGCHLSMHPTGYDEASALANVNGYLEDRGSSPTATSWAFQRFMSVAAATRQITGVTPAIWMTEFTHTGGTGKWGAVASAMEVMFEVFIACSAGTASANWLPSALDGVPPKIVPVWFDAFNGSENQGMMTATGGDQPEELTTTFERMAKAFLAS